jgi:hypothetical protein
MDEQRFLFCLSIESLFHHSSIPMYLLCGDILVSSRRGQTKILMIPGNEKSFDLGAFYL